MNTCKGYPVRVCALCGHRISFPACHVDVIQKGDSSLTSRAAPARGGMRLHGLVEAACHASGSTSRGCGRPRETRSLPRRAAPASQERSPRRRPRRDTRPRPRRAPRRRWSRRPLRATREPDAAAPAVWRVVDAEEAPLREGGEGAPRCAEGRGEAPDETCALARRRGARLLRVYAARRRAAAAMVA